MTQRQVQTPHFFTELIDGIDRGIESHLAWNHRLMRCSLLHEAPGAEMLAENGYRLCELGVWLDRSLVELAVFNPAVMQSIDQAHCAMHAAVRRLCAKILLHEPAVAGDFEAYEQGQRTMVAQLHTIRQQIIEASMQHDVLTGLPLRHGVEHAFKQRQEEALHTHKALWVAMIEPTTSSGSTTPTAMPSVIWPCDTLHTG